MIIHRIILENIFSYKGLQTFELSPTKGEDRRLVLVMGRNGFGKTSLLNSVKLLFLGTEDKGLRRNMPRSTYVLGDGKNWEGILNRQARAEGITSCSVQVEIGPENKIEFTAKRSWDLEGDNFSSKHEILEVIIEDRHLAGDAAEARLDEFLPRELVPFFFFDGEEIRYLAEVSDVHRAEAMERLLSLSFVSGVEGELEGIINSWRRETLPAEIQAQISMEEAKLTAAKKANEAFQAKKTDIEEQRSELQEAADRVYHSMERLHQTGGLVNTAALDQEITDIEDELQKKQNNLAYSLANDAPIIANPSLIDATIKPLHALVDKKTKASESILDTLFSVLPQRLFYEAPQPRMPLSEDQRKFYIKKLRGILDTFGTKEDESPVLFEDLDLARARTLLEFLRGMNSSMKTIREDRARRLREISRLKVKLEDKRADRREAQYGSSEAAEQYRKLSDQFTDFQRHIGGLSTEIERLQERIDENNREEERIDRLISNLVH